MDNLGFTFHIGPAVIVILALIAAGFIGYLFGESRGARKGFGLGQYHGASKVNHILGHALSEELAGQVNTAIEVYLSDPENMDHITKGTPEPRKVA